MNPPLLFALGPTDLWYAMPLIVAVSLVYAATRHEDIHLILRRALRVGGMIFTCMAAIFVVLFLVSYWL